MSTVVEFFKYLSPIMPSKKKINSALIIIAIATLLVGTVYFLGLADWVIADIYFVAVVFIIAITIVLPFLVHRFGWFQSKRDPFFWKRNYEKGGDLWLARNLSLYFLAAVTLANAFTPVAYQFYLNFFGTGRGSLMTQAHRIGSVTLHYLDLNWWWDNVLPWHVLPGLQTWTLGWVVTFAIFAFLGAHNLYTRWRNTTNTTTIEYGSAGFTDPEDVKIQYSAVPDRGLPFKGYGGVPVAHTYNHNLEGLALMMATLRNKNVPDEWYRYEPKEPPKDKDLKRLPGKYYQDSAAVNSLVVGETRSGKGETIVLATIDLISRGDKDQSLVVADLKGELFTKTSAILKRRNYDVRVLNFDNLNFSMSINLLSMALEHVQNKNYTKAVEEVGRLSTTLFPETGQDSGNSAYFRNGSRSVFSGLVLTTFWFLLQNNELEKATIGNVVDLLQVLGSEKEIVDSSGKRLRGASVPTGMGKTKQLPKLDILIETMTALRKQLASRQEHDELLSSAINSFSQARFGSSDSSGNIYSSMFAEVAMFSANEAVRKLTTKNSFRYSQVGFPRVMELHLPDAFRNIKANIRFEVNGKAYNEVVISDEVGIIQFAIEPKLDNQTTFDIDFNFRDNPDEVKETKIQINAVKDYEYSGGMKTYIKRDPFSNLPIIKGYKERNMTTTGNLSVGEVTLAFDYSEKRTAVFVVLPPLNKQYYNLAMFFFEQLYQQNYDWAQRNKNRNINRIHFLMDEFGNLPAWDGLTTKLSAALGYNFAFTLILQNLEQLNEKYGHDGADSIIGNSSNFLYIKTSSITTAKTLSDRLGVRTITVNNPGNDQKSGDSAGRTVTSRDLLKPEELMQFRPSQMVVWRSAKNYDTHGAAVDTKPIFDYGTTAMPFAYNLLQGYLADSPELARVEMDTPHRFLDLSKYSIDYHTWLDTLYDRVYPRKEDPTLIENRAKNKRIIAEDNREKRRRNSSNLRTGRESAENPFLLKPQDLNDVELVHKVSEAIADKLKRYIDGMPNMFDPKTNEADRKKLKQLNTLFSAASNEQYPFAQREGQKKFLVEILGEGAWTDLVQKINIWKK